MNKINILYIVNSLDFFISHRLEIAKKCSENGFKVFIAAPYNEQFNEIKKKYNFELEHINFDRKNRNLFKRANIYFEYIYIISKS